MRRLLLALLVVAAVPASAGAQTVVDSTRRIVGGRPILDSDIRIARDLKLVPTAATTDDQILTELENRMLAMAAIGRLTALPDPTPEEVAQRRQQWERAFDSNAAARLAEVHMSEAELMAWLREDIRLEKYEQQRFGREADPPKAIQSWIQGLRKRAGLK